MCNADASSGRREGGDNVTDRLLNRGAEIAAIIPDAVGGLYAGDDVVIGQRRNVVGLLGLSESGVRHYGLK